MTSTAPIIGIAWYLERDYDTLKSLFTDGDKLPATFDQWLRQAENVRQRYIRQGYVVIQAHIDSATFASWCAANGYDVNANGRIQFANAEASRIAMEIHKHV